jgi:hypothetical protein
LKQPLIKNFCGGPGGGFYKKSPLAAGGKIDSKVEIIYKKHYNKFGGTAWEN